MPDSPSRTPKKILVVDDDDAFRLGLKKSLTEDGYMVTDFASPKEALKAIETETFDTVVSDVSMPEMSGIELLKAIKTVKKELPVILITGFSALVETQEAYSLGASEFIPKPFKREDLLGALKISCGGEEFQNTKESQDDEFCKLSLDDFISGREIQFDIFVRLSNKKYVKIAHHGEDLSLERIARYKSKGISYLYMFKADFRKYIGFNLNIAKKLKSSDVHKAKKLAFMKHTGEIILEYLRFSEVDEETFSNARSMVETTLAIVTDQGDIYDLLEMLNSRTDFLYTHSLGVSLYSVMIAIELGWTSPMNKFKLALGGLLHDVGKKEIEEKILLKQRKDLTPDEVKLYESHPIRGRDILDEIRSVPSEVLHIVFEHHENYVGAGFPRGAKKQNIHPLARLVSVANEFCNFAIKGPKGAALPATDAIKRMASVHSESYDPMPFSALKRLFKIDPPLGKRK